MEENEVSELEILLRKRFGGLSKEEIKRANKLIDKPYYSVEARDCYFCIFNEVKDPGKEIYDTGLCEECCRSAIRFNYSALV